MIPVSFCIGGMLDWEKIADEFAPKIKFEKNHASKTSRNYLQRKSRNARFL